MNAIARGWRNVEIVPTVTIFFSGQRVTPPPSPWLPNRDIFYFRNVFGGRNVILRLYFRLTTFWLDWYNFMPQRGAFLSFQVYSSGTSNFSVQCQYSCNLCGTTIYVRRWMKMETYPHTQPVSQPRALHSMTRVPASFSSRVINVSHSHRVIDYQSPSFFGLDQNFVAH